jgi:hypothetical protein
VCVSDKRDKPRRARRRGREKLDVRNGSIVPGTEQSFEGRLRFPQVDETVDGQVNADASDNDVDGVIDLGQGGII